ncbi:MAG: hypothetical protein HY322_05775 [Betaproteobacteria bacterium]|nr:hypothetical protein [Betaproteobacteria bacterium]
MNARTAIFGLAAAALLALGAASAHAQQTPSAPARPESGLSDVGSFEAVPYDMRGSVTLRAEEKVAVRRLEDKHIAEVRTLEDRFDKELRALRLKQSAEREVLFKSFTARR